VRPNVWPLPLQISLLCGLLVSSTIYAQIPGMKPAKKWDLNGYVHASLQGTKVDNAGKLFDQQINQRFNFEYRFSDSLRFNVGMRNRLFAGDSLQIEYFSKIIEHDPGYLDLSINWLENDNVVVNSQFDRLYLDWREGDWQVRLGRVRVNWGMATIWNANDIFNTYSIYDVDYIERSGSDAVQVSRRLGFASSAELVFQPDEDSELNSFAGRYLFNHEGWDMQLITGKSKFDQVLATGFAGAVSGAGIRGEFTWFSPTQDEWQGKDLLTSTVSTLELDYSFSSESNWYMHSAILHISQPQKIDNALLYLTAPLSARTLSFTRFTWYADIGFDITPLSRFLFLSSYYQDGSYFIGATNTYSLSDNWELAAIVQRFDGSENSVFGQSASLFAFLQINWGF